MDCTPTTNNLLPSYTHKHTLPAFILLSDHTHISVHFLPFASAGLLPWTLECLLWTNSSIKGVFAPWSTKFGLGFFSAFLLSSVVSSRQSLPFCEGISGPGMWSGHLWTKEHSCSRSCCLLIIRKNECAVASSSVYEIHVLLWTYIYGSSLLFVAETEVCRRRDVFSLYWPGSSSQNVISSPLASATFCLWN